MDGSSDSENSYLVEGRESANLVCGYSHTNVPFDFIQEVQLKTSGIEDVATDVLAGSWPSETNWFLASEGI